MPEFRKSIFDRLNDVKEIAKKNDPMWDEDILKLLRSLSKYHYNKKKYMLLGPHKIIYNTMIKQGILPDTAYKWALLENIPEEIKHQLEQGLIGQKKAKRFAHQRKRCVDTALHIDIKKRGLMLIRGL